MSAHARRIDAMIVKAKLVAATDVGTFDLSIPIGGCSRGRAQGDAPRGGSCSEGPPSGTRSLASPPACMERGIAVAKTVLAAAPAKGSGSGPKNNCPTTVKIEARKGARVGKTVALVGGYVR